jgi:hypothetical protein
MTMEPSTMAVRTNQPLNLAHEPLDSEHILACKRAPYEQVRDIVEGAGKGKWMERFIAVSPLDCCKDPANYDIEAWYSTAKEQAIGTPDLYKFYCRVCEDRVDLGLQDGCCKVAFCVGGSHPTDPTKQDNRPIWEIR